MKLRLSYIGVNTTSFPRILVTDTGAQVMASNDSLRQAIFEAQQYLTGLQQIEREFSSDSIVEQDKQIDLFLRRKQSPDATAGSSSVATDTETSATKSSPNVRIVKTV